MSLILDASLIFAWIFPDETTAEVEHVLEKVRADGCVVPEVWRLEVANGLTIAVRRGRISPAFRAQAIKVLELTPITVDPETGIHAWTGTLQLADRFQLTAYDASYLELAYRRALPLATLDRSLRAGATALGVPLLGL